MAHLMNHIYANPVNNQTVPCLECAANGETYMMFVQTKAHLRLKHNMTKEEYVAKYPEQESSAYWGTLYKQLHNQLAKEARKVKRLGKIAR